MLIVDWDVHHGNGTQAAFYDDPRVLFFSMHQAGHYPGHRHGPEVGRGDGAGFTVNVPLQAGAGDGAVRLAFESLVAPLARAFRPQLVLVSAGYDPQKGDPWAACGSRRRVPVDGRLPGRAGQEVGAAGPLCFLEGGYVPEMMARLDRGHLRGAAGRDPRVRAGRLEPTSGPTCARRSKRSNPTGRVCSRAREITSQVRRRVSTEQLRGG